MNTAAERKHAVDAITKMRAPTKRAPKQSRALEIDRRNDAVKLKRLESGEFE